LFIIPPDCYNGVLQDSNEVGIEIWKSLYSGIFSCKYNSNSDWLPAVQYINNLVDQNTPESDENIPVCAMAIEYEKIKDDAVTSGILNASNGQIVELNSQNPYDKHVLFSWLNASATQSHSTIKISHFVIACFISLNLKWFINFSFVQIVQVLYINAKN